MITFEQFKQVRKLTGVNRHNAFYHISDTR